MLWGGGTAIGEIPPYAFSYHAAKAGHRNEEFDRMFQARSAPDSQAQAAVFTQSSSTARHLDSKTNT